MKYLDIIFQSCVILVGLISGISAYGTSDWLGVILITQLVLGPIQLFSSFISVIAKSSFWKWKCWHLILSLIYLLVLIILTNLKGLPDSEFWSLSIFTVPAWLLATYYYALTWLWILQLKRKQSSFLPHINF